MDAMGERLGGQLGGRGGAGCTQVRVRQDRVPAFREQHGLGGVLGGRQVCHGGSCIHCVHVQRHTMPNSPYFRLSWGPSRQRARAFHGSDTTDKRHSHIMRSRDHRVDRPIPADRSPRADRPIPAGRPAPGAPSLVQNAGREGPFASTFTGPATSPARPAGNAWLPYSRNAARHDAHGPDAGRTSGPCGGSPSGAVHTWEAGSRAGRLSMKELTEKTARPGPGSPYPGGDLSPKSSIVAR